MAAPGSSAGGLDVLRAVQGYVNKMIANPSGVKVLLLDQETTSILSLASTQSTLLSNEVYLTDRIDNPARALPTSHSSSGSYPPNRSGVERLPHLKCICFLRPTEESIAACEREIKEGRYGGYWLYFTNVLKKSQIERLAEADELELVREVQEYFADYSPLTPSHYSLSLLPTPLHPSPTERVIALYGDSPSLFSPSSTAFSRHLDGLQAVLLSLKKKPIIRYERMSGQARRLGQELAHSIESQPDLWDFRRGAGGNQPVLLILDRRNDPVTPLLSQWTYQAMVHELLGITNGRVDLSKAQDVREDMKEIVLSPDQDPFFAANLYDNFGDLGAHLSSYVSDYSSRSATSSASKIETVADMKRFIEEYPEQRKLGGNVSKHVALVGELSRLVDSQHLLSVSELEQSLASNESHSSDLRTVQMMLSSPDIPVQSKLRLAILYALRYQKFERNSISAVYELLRQQNVPDAEMVHIMLNFAGADQRQDDLFANENLFSRGKSVLKGLKGVENVYTQHTPHVVETIEHLLRGRLREASYPFVDGQQGTTAAPPGRPQDVIIFIVGGTTYEEAKHVAALNATFAAGHGLNGSVGPNGPVGAGTKILLGGTCVHNSRTFLQMVRDASFGFSNFSNPPPPPPLSTASSTATTSAISPLQQQQQQQQQSLNLNIGPVSLNVGGGAGGALEAGVDAARDGLRDLFGRVKDGVSRM